MSQTVDFSDFNQLFEDARDKALLESALLVERDAVNNVNVDRGTLRSSIFHTVEDGEATVASSLLYAGAVEYGGPPRSVPVEPLKVWARRKLGDERIGWAIKKTIEKYGTSPKPFLRPALEKNEKNIEKIFDKYFDKVNDE